MGVAARTYFEAHLGLIQIKGARRPIRQDAVADLKSSMESIGLQTPITLREDEETNEYILVAGAHRLEAARRLGWERIPACVVMWDATEARLWEIAENLHRADLTVLERDEHIAEWIKLIENKVLSQVATKPQGGRPAVGVRAAARDLNVDKDAAHRARKVASITPEAKDAARDAGLDDNQSALLKIAAETTPEKQTAKVIELKRASEHPKDDHERSAEWRRSFEKLWNKAPDPADRVWARDWIDNPIMDTRFGDAS